MKLNYDCVRDVMLAIESMDYVVEDEDGYISYEEIEFNDLVNRINGRKERYSRVEIFYTLQNLKQAGYLDVSDQWADGHAECFSINYITYSGHRFIDTIRDNKVWSHTKGILSTFASVSVTMVENIASQVITNLVNQYILQHPFGPA